MISLLQHWLPDVLELLRSSAGALLFMPLYALWVSLLLPGVWASMLAGVLYGTWLGSGLVFVGACLGAVVVLLLGEAAAPMLLSGLALAVLFFAAARAFWLFALRFYTSASS